MNKTDLVFTLSVAGLVWNNIQQQVHALISNTLFAWLNIIFVIIAILAYALYEKLQGVPVTPAPPGSNTPQ